MGMILRIASSRIVGQGDIVGRSGYFSLNLSANSVMRGRLDARRTLKSLVADLRSNKKSINACFYHKAIHKVHHNKQMFFIHQQDISVLYFIFLRLFTGKKRNHSLFKQTP